MYRLPDAFDARPRDVSHAAAGGGSTSTTCSSCCIVSAIVGTVVPANMLAGVKPLAVAPPTPGPHDHPTAPQDPSLGPTPPPADPHAPGPDAPGDTLLAAPALHPAGRNDSPSAAEGSPRTSTTWQGVLGFFTFPLTVLCAVGFAMLGLGLGAVLAVIVPFVVFAKVYESNGRPARDGLVKAALLSVGLAILLVLEVVTWLGVLDIL